MNLRLFFINNFVLLLLSSFGNIVEHAHGTLEIDFLSDDLKSLRIDRKAKSVTSPKADVKAKSGGNSKTEIYYTKIDNIGEGTDAALNSDQLAGKIIVNKLPKTEELYLHYRTGNYLYCSRWSPR